MGYEKTNSLQNENSRTPQSTTQFGSRPFPAPVQMKPKEQKTPEELENEAFNQNKFEAFGLQLKEKSGTITPVEQEQLGLLQAKMDDFWAQRQERASRSGFDFSKVSVTPPGEPAAPQIQPMSRLGTPGMPLGGQRSLSNSPLQSSASPLQRKLTIGQPGDKYEQEADQVASQVVEQINSPKAVQSTQGQSVQRQEELEEELQAKPTISELQRSPLSLEVQREAMPEEEDIQAKSLQKRQEAIAGGETSTDLDTAINSARGEGQPLEAGLQQSMGQAMGADFSGVRVHTDAQSDQLNQSIQAKAFTTGQDVFFRQGAYEPGSRGGQELIAHELTHVVQQNGGAVQQNGGAVQRVPNTEKLKGEDYANNVQGLISAISKHIPGFSDYTEISTALNTINTERPNATVMSGEVTGEDLNSVAYGTYVGTITRYLDDSINNKKLLQEKDPSTFNAERKDLVAKLNPLFDQLPSVAVDTRVAVVIEKKPNVVAVKTKIDSALKSLANAMKHQLYVLLPVKGQ